MPFPLRAAVADASSTGTAARRFVALLILALLRPSAPAAQPVVAPADSVVGSPAAASGADSAIARALTAAGLENIAAGGTRPIRVRYENRGFRHSASALGTIARITGSPTLAFEQRLGLVTAAIADTVPGSAPVRVVFPSDAGFPAPPGGRSAAPTTRTVDLLVGPLFTYALGGILYPIQARTELQTDLRYNAWPGGRLRAALVIPIHDDFQSFDPEQPDVKKVRPGPITVEQYAWSPGAALFSGTAGVLGNNRYGLSMGVARPLGGGAFLLDAQSDLTGFMAFEDSGLVASTPNHWSGFAGVTYRPPHLDLGIRVRAVRFLRGDSGVEVELRRVMGDFEVAFFEQRIQGTNIGGVRLVLPVPPMVRPVGGTVRVLPVERFPFTYREESQLVGESLRNVASREDYLRQLDGPALQANAYRYRQARDGKTTGRANERPQWVSLTGMTGFINTPWCGVMKDREVEFGYNHIPKSVAYDYRGKHPNEVYYGALGFLPHVEVGIRWTVMPGAHPFRYLLPESPYVDQDRMFSGRIEVLEPRQGRPGFAVGIEDARGTRRFHSTYGVAGLPFDIYRLQNRVTIGYAPHVFTASRRTLDGLFGAFEVSPRRSVVAALEHDTEKWNSMLGINLGFGLRARVALLDLEHLSFGAGWFKAL